MPKRKSKKSNVKQPTPSSAADPFRHLGNRLAGVVFGCTDETYRECVDGGVFGLPFSHFVYVQRIKVGLPLFLFNYFTRELHGVFAAASAGQLNIKPHGWSGKANERTIYPAQVRVKVHKEATPLKEHQFKSAIGGNYDGKGSLFQFELDIVQVKHLCRLYKSTVPQVMKGVQFSLLGPPQLKQQRPSRNENSRGHSAPQKQDTPSSGSQHGGRDRDSSQSSDETVIPADGLCGAGRCARVLYSISAKDATSASATCVQARFGAYIAEV